MYIERETIEGDRQKERDEDRERVFVREKKRAILVLVTGSIDL